MEAASIPWRPLGEMLVGQGLLTHLQLESALGAQEQSGRKLGEILVQRGYVTAGAVTSSLAEHFGIDPHAEPPAERLTRPVLRIVRLDEEPEIVDMPSPADIGRHRMRLAQAQRAVVQRDLRIAELESLLARLGHLD